MKTILFVLIIYSMSGCVPRPDYKYQLDLLQRQCDESSRQYDEYIKNLEKELKEKDAQLVEKLRWKGHKSTPLTGREGWQK